MKLHLACLIAVCLAACSGPNTNRGGGGGTGGTGGGAMVERGPKAIMIDGDPNGLWWDAATHTLYIADDNNNRVLTYTDQAGVTPLATLPAAPANGPGLGQIVRTSDGTLVVTRFGYGTAGDVVYVSPDGGTGTVPNLDVMRRRIGLTVAPDGSLYDSYFVKTTTTVGGVSKLDLANGETEVATGFVKPVGVLVVGPALYISDQAQGQVYKATVANPSGYTVLAMQGLTAGSSPDLLTVGPGNLLYTGGGTGSAFSIDTGTGAVTNVGSGFQAVRGTAYDADGKRLFISDHDPNGVSNFLQIFPIDP